MYLHKEAAPNPILAQASRKLRLRRSAALISLFLNNLHWAAEIGCLKASEIADSRRR